MTLWLARHAQPLVEPGVCYGQLDVAADAHANADCASALAVALPLGTVVAASPLKRCDQLARALSRLRPDLVITSDARLMEMNFGAWEGQRWDAIGPAPLAAWTDDFAHHRPGGGESVSQFLARVQAAFNARPEGQPTAWLTHAGVIRAAGLLHAGTAVITQASQWPVAAPAFGQWWVLGGRLRA